MTHTQRLAHYGQPDPTDYLDWDDRECDHDECGHTCEYTWTATELALEEVA